MMSLSTIREISREAAEQAAQEGLRPFVYFTTSEVDEFDRFPFPFLGDYSPPGWELSETYFVDSSGYGLPGEPALTAEQFRDTIRARLAEEAEKGGEGQTLGWAVAEAGQFQVYVGEYVRVKR